MVRICAECGMNNPSEARFCSQCGSDLDASTSPSGRKCPRCGSSNSAEFHFCGHCGTSLETPVPSQPTIPPSLVEKIARSGMQHAGELREVAVLFADISDFTAMAGRMEPEAVYDLVNRCVQLLDEAVYRYEGVVDKHIGDGVMALFGAPLAHENDAERAVLAALDMQAALQKLDAEQRDRLQPPLGLRIGLHYGTVVAGQIGSDLHMDYTVIGDTVNLAARLQEAVEPGDILVSDRIYQVTAPLFTFRPLSPLRLKGYPNPVQAYEVVGARPQKGRIRGVPGLSQVPMIGREKELANLEGALDLLLNEGKGQVVIVSGEAGIGKTRIIAELWQHLPREKVLTLTGTCLAYTSSVNYYPFAEILRAYFGLEAGGDGNTQWERVSERLMELGLKEEEYTLAPLLTLLGLPMPETLQEQMVRYTPQQLQTRIFMAVRDLLLAEASRRPVILTIDDLHWADELSLDLLVFLVDAVKQSSLMLIIISRPVRERMSTKLGPAAREKLGKRYLHIRLEELSAEETESLLAALLASVELPEEFRDTILERAEGNPFYLEEILRMLIDQRVLKPGPDDVWQLRPDADLASLAVPPNLQGLIMARFDRLREGARRMLQMAAVIGQRIPVRLLRAAMAALGEVEGFDANLKEVVTLDFLVLQREEPEREYIFFHAVIQEAIYQSLLQRHRRRLHRLVAEQIESDYGERLEDHLDELAQHYSNSTVYEKALHYVLLCARRAAFNFANERAIELYEQAETLLLEVPDAPRQYQVTAFIGLADVLMMVGDNEGARDRYRTALRWLTSGVESWSEEDAAALQRKIANTFEAEGASEAVLWWLGAALESLGGADSPRALLERTRIFSDRGWASLHLGQYDMAETWLLNALEIVRDEQHYDVIASIYSRLGALAFRQGRWSQATRFGRQGLALQEMAGDVQGMAATYNNLGMLMQLQGQRNEALAHYDSARDIFEHTGDSRGLALNYNQVGQLYLNQGDLDQSRTMLEKGWEFAERMNYLPAQVHLLTSMVELSLWQWDHDQAMVYLVQAMNLADAAPMPEEVAICRCLKAIIHMEREEWDEAQVSAEEALAFASALGESSESYGRALRTSGELALRMGDLDGASRHLSQAITLFTSPHNLFDLGQCYLSMARLEHLRGNEKGAHTLRQQATNIFHTLDVPLILQRIEQEFGSSTA